ncbi:MAG: phytanoyl-CoA dioxygenase family protein [Verrucomicrobia bacterium]|nr:phytanoyl-CoA dioxygenase family protein [Verrucomicrobiota bacterium]
MNYIQKILLFFCLSASLNSSELKGFLTPEDIALFHKQGYLLKSQCLSPIEMNLLTNTVTKAIDEALKELSNSQNLIFSDDDQIFYINGSRVVGKRGQDGFACIARINGCGGMQPALLTTLRSEKMIRTFFELLGTNDLEHLIAQIHPKLPGDGVAYPRHQDIEFRRAFDSNWQDVLGNGSYAICVIPIDPMNQENGGLWIDTNYPEESGEQNIIWINAKPGDLLFMHPHLYHGSGPNNNPTTSRKTLLTGFCAFGANHQTYPGAHVNTRITLTKNDTINFTEAPWSKDSFTTPFNGH